MIHADDTQIYNYFFPSKIGHGISVIQRDAQAVADWAELNGLEFNFKKSKFMLLRSKAYILSNQLNFNNHINNNPIQSLQESWTVDHTHTGLESSCGTHSQKSSLLPWLLSFLQKNPQKKTHSVSFSSTHRLCICSLHRPR